MPASDAPTTTIEPIMAVALLARSAGSLLDDGDRLLWTALHGLLDLGPQLLGRRLVQDVEKVVVADLEDLWCDPHADRVALTQVVVDHHSHLGPLGSSSGRNAHHAPTACAQDLMECQIWP